MVRFCANLTTMFIETPLIDRFVAARKAGFSAVELSSPYEIPARKLQDLLSENELDLIMFDTPAGALEKGEHGMAAVPGRAAEFRDGFCKALDYADILKPRIINVLMGNAQGSVAQQTVVENLSWAVEQAGERTLSLEPANAREMPGYFLQSNDTAVALIETLDLASVKLLLDLYHMQIGEGDLSIRINRLIRYVAHVQMAGVPGRCDPEQGEVNLRHVLSLLEALGYRGWIGCEFKTLGTSMDRLARLRPAAQNS